MTLADGPPDLPPPRQSGVIPYRRTGRGLEVLLITRRGVDEWIVPKGGVERDLLDHESAAKEAREEAGVEGRVTSQIAGSFHYSKRGTPLEVVVFDLEVQSELSEWPEQHQRQRRWADVAEATQLVSNPELRQLISTLDQRLADRAPGKPEP